MGRSRRSREGALASGSRGLAAAFASLPRRICVISSRRHAPAPLASVSERPTRRLLTEAPVPALYRQRVLHREGVCS
jgi:hypothetical protein